SCAHRRATSTLHTLSLHDALPIFRVSLPEDQAGERPRRRDPGPRPRGGTPVSVARGRQYRVEREGGVGGAAHAPGLRGGDTGTADRKSTRLNSSHVKISYAVFCLK